MGTFFLIIARAMTGGNCKKIVKYLRSIKTRRTSLRLQNKTKPCTEREQLLPFHSLGFFSNIPQELLFYIFSCIPLYDLASMTLTSRAFRDKILTYHYSTQALPILKPVIRPTSSGKEDIQRQENCDEVTFFYIHFHNLGKYWQRTYAK